MERERFIRLVRRALREIPPPFKQHLKNVDIVVKRRPSAVERRDAGLARDESMYGFYHGVPMTERGSDYTGVLPDRITLFATPIVREAGPDESALKRVIGETVVHEIAHHFGIDDERLHEIDRY